MFKNILQSFSEGNILAIAALIFFFLFFLGVIWAVLRLDKKFINYAEKLPFDDGKEILNNSGVSNGRAKR